MSKKEYPAKLTNGYYRVREVWEDEASQLGAYRLLANAKAKCDENPGSRVFDNDGNVIYPEEAVPDTGADESEEKAIVDDIPEEKPETTAPVEDTPAEKEAEAEVDENEFPTAEELPATIAYGKLKTLMNIREMPDTGAEVVTVYKRNTLIEIVEFCAGWLKIKCPEAVSGLAYVLNSADTYLNVAAYIRVSTDSSDQENSYETQERYFHQLIESNPDWNPIGVYSDYGISGTVKDKRVGFKRLLRHCREGKIDRIVCKSISRFSRNTADFMTALNILHDNNVTILFEKENLDTADPTSDFILTTLAAIAQEESRSISRNINLGNKMRYPRGEVKNMVIYGYRYNGKMVTTESGYQYRDIEIVEEEAKIVRRIFQEVAEGTAYTDVARGLNYDRIPAPETVAVKARKKISKKGQLNSDLEEGWTGRIISQMIQRERYTGAVLIQKKYTVDFLNHNIQRNNGELPQYLVKNHHPAIIDEELFETVQKIRRANAAKKEKGVKKGSKPFSGRILCGECGRFFRVRNSKHYPVWFCPTAEIYNGKRICHTERVYEEQIVRAFRKAIIERFRLSAQPIHDNVEVADIMSGRYGEQFEGFTKEADDFVPQMIKRLENIQHTDFMERDRAFYKRQIATLQIGMESSGKKLRLLESQNDVMQTRRELLGDESIDEAVIQSNAEKIRRLKEKLDRDMDEKKHLEERLEYLEGYWEDLENDHERRERAIEWMKELPKGRDGVVQFLNGVTSDYCKAFVLSITVHSPLNYTVHWYDDTRTEVVMYSNIEDYRYTASYFDGQVMRDNCYRKKYVKKG